jgi:hypothetical protein
MLLDLPVKVLEVFPPISTSTVSPKPYQFSCQSAHVILRSESSTANCWASGPMSAITFGTRRLHNIWSMQSRGFTLIALKMVVQEDLALRTSWRHLHTKMIIPSIAPEFMLIAWSSLTTQATLVSVPMNTMNVKMNVNMNWIHEC